MARLALEGTIGALLPAVQDWIERVVADAPAEPFRRHDLSAARREAEMAEAERLVAEAVRKVLMALKRARAVRRAAARAANPHDYHEQPASLTGYTRRYRAKLIAGHQPDATRPSFAISALTCCPIRRATTM